MPEAPVLLVRVLQGDPEPDARGLVRVQERAVLVRDHLAANRGLLWAVDGNAESVPRVRAVGSLLFRRNTTQLEREGAAVP